MSEIMNTNTYAISNRPNSFVVAVNVRRICNLGTVVRSGMPNPAWPQPALCSEGFMERCRVGEFRLIDLSRGQTFRRIHQDGRRLCIFFPTGPSESAFEYS